MSIQARLAARFKAFFKWTNDIEVRQESLRTFASSFGLAPDPDGFMWGDALYLLIHFDLMTIGPDGPIDRSEVYEVIGQFVEAVGGTRLGGSVYAAPIGPLIPSERCATMFWNELSKVLNGKLLPGDSFFLHYAPAFRNLMGGIAQVVRLGRTSLDEAADPPQLQNPFEIR